MATVNILPAFTYKWAQDATAEAIDDAQWRAGWGFIGATPPSVEQFNKVHQIADEKSNYLYAQMKAIYDAAGQVPAAGTLTTLRDALSTLAPGVVGSVRNLAASLNAASASATLTADEIVVGVTLAGARYRLVSFNETINLATVGANGMDTGLAPVSGYVAIYAIYNPSNGAQDLLATNASSAVVPQIYGGANMPAGYTASALISVLQTNASRLMLPFVQQDRDITVSSVVSSSSTVALSNASVTLAVPHNAKKARIAVQQTTATPASNYAFGASSTSPVSGGKATMTQSIGGGSAFLSNFYTNGEVVLQTPRTVFMDWTVVGGSSPNLQIAIAGYSI